MRTNYDSKSKIKGETIMKPVTILVLDGQGGRIGRQIIDGIRARLPEADIAAVNEALKKRLKRAVSPQFMI